MQSQNTDFPPAPFPPQANQETFGNTDPELDIPPPVVFNETPKKKLPIPLWLIILIIAGFLISFFITAIIIINGSKSQAKYQSKTVLVTATPQPDMQNTTSGESQQKTATGSILFSNPELGISLEYPPDWKKDDSQGQLSFIGPNGSVSIAIEASTDKDIKSWFTEHYKDHLEPPKAGETHVNPAKITFLQTTIDSKTTPLRYYLVSSNKKVLSITFSISEDANINKNLQVIYGRIIDSVKPL